MARRRWGPEGVAGCARCGSRRVHPKLLVMGPVPGIDSDAYNYLCEECKYDGRPVIFDTEEERAKFEAEAKGRAQPSPERPSQETLSIPILPIDAEPLLDIRPLDLLPFRIAKVVSLHWDGKSLQPGGHRMDFQDYWDAVGGPRYNASRVFMYDLSGINRANPNFDVMRALVKRCDVWLDLGAREADEIMDGYMLDVERVVVGSKTMPSLDTFIEAFGLSNEILPSVDWDGRVVWRDSRETRTDLKEVLESLRSVGFRSLCVIDLRRLGTESGPDPQVMELLQAIDAEIYLGGGLRETDIAALKEAGFAGGLVDPYTPVVRSILQPPRREEPVPQSAPKPEERPRPSPGAAPDA